MKKRIKRFLGTLAIIGVFAIGTVFGAEAILKFTGTNTINEAETLIQELIQERNTIVDEYNKLDTTATDKITKLNATIENLNTQITTLTQQKEELEKQINGDENDKTHLGLKKQIEKLKTENAQLRVEIESLKGKITSLEAEIKNKDNELSNKDRLLEEKDKKIKYYENIEPTKEIARLNEELNIANSKCKELKGIIDGVTRKEFEKSELMEDN